MENINWRNIAELIGIVAIVASLVFVGIQLRQEQQIAISQVGQADEASSAQIDLAVATNAHIWLKSNSGAPLSPEEHLFMSRLVTAMYRRARIEAVMRRSLGQSGHAPIIDFAIELHENPGARAIWEEQAEKEALYWETLRSDDTFRHAYHQEVRDELAKLDRMSED